MENAIRRVIFDFDNTLFDTERIKDFFWEVAAVNGYDREEAHDFYAAARQENDWIRVSFDGYVQTVRQQALADGRPFDENAAARIHAAMNEASGLVPGAREILAVCAVQNLERHLLSLGVASWQEEKVRQSGIARFFPTGGIHYIDDVREGKQEAMRNLFGRDWNGANAVIFNDKPDETADLLRSFPELRAGVRREVRDRRYGENDFRDLEKAFRPRVVWSEQLADLARFFIPCYSAAKV